MKTVKCHEERRREIIQTAKALFSKFGVERTSISQLVKEMDIAHGLFYYYFKSKEEVTEAVIEAMLEDFEKTLSDRLNAAEDDFCAQLVIFVNTLFDSSPKPVIDFPPKDLVMSRYHDRALSILHNASKRLWEKGVEQGLLTMRHSDLVFQIIMSGSLFLVERGQITREMALELIAQTLGLPPMGRAEG